MQVATETKRRTHKTRADSEAVRAASERRAICAPLLVKGISGGKQIRVSEAMFGKLDVDASYQRGNTSMIAELVRVLTSGGEVHDPVTLCRRPWASDGKLWIVDGFQRVCAFQQCRKPFDALVYESESLDSEKAFFLALNVKRSVSVNVIVRSWGGPSSQLLLRANDDVAHPLADRINFQQSGNASRISAGVVARATLAAATGLAASGRGTIFDTLKRLDASLKISEQRARAEHFLRLMGMVFPKGHPPHMLAMVLADVAHERWDAHLAMPPHKIIDRMQRKNWEGEIPAFVQKYRSVLSDSIKKIWK